MATILLLFILAALATVGWFLWPSIGEEIETARRRRRIDQIRRRTLMDLDYLREKAWRERDDHARQRLDRVVNDLDL